MSEPVKLTKKGDVFKDDNGAYANCQGCYARIDMHIDESGEMFGTCKACGCHLDADKDGIWGVSFNHVPMGDDE